MIVLIGEPLASAKRDMFHCAKPFAENLDRGLFVLLLRALQIANPEDLSILFPSFRSFTSKQSSSGGLFVID